MKIETKKQYELIIFDWDGTVVDSVPNIVESLKRSALDSALPLLEDKAYKDVIGLSLVPAIAVLYPDLDQNSVKQYMEGYRRHYRVLEQCPPKPFSGALEGLKHLQAKGMQMAVATGKSRAGLQRSMDANDLEQFVSVFRTSDEARSKPDPDMLEQIIAELGVSREQVLLVGDSCFDLQMAHNAGIDRLAVSYGAQIASELAVWKPVYIADSFTDFIDWLELDKLKKVV